jgi:hypothetical protein
MKRIFIISLFILLGLGSFAQSFVVDTTFQPFFDIRAQTNPIINGIYEDQNSGRLYAAGTFVNNFMGNRFEGIVTYDSVGSLSLLFSFGAGSFNASVSDIWPLGINKLYVFNSSGGGFIDTTGSQNFASTNWRINMIRTVACRTGRPYFFSGRFFLICQWKGRYRQSL